MSEQRVHIWSEADTQREVSKRYRNAGIARARYETGWRYNERLVYSSSLVGGTGEVSAQPSIFSNLAADADYSGADMNVAYLMRNLRFLHAQMSANPPSVVMKPVTTDQENVRKADAADKVVRHAMKKYLLQERVDQTSLHTLIYGTGLMKTVWDHTAGEILGHDPATGNLQLEGDIRVSVPFMWNIRIDPDARSIDEIKWITEDLYIDEDEANARWPGREKELESARVSGRNSGEIQRVSSLGEQHREGFNTLKLVEYWETGLPSNGYLGRYCVTTEAGAIIEKCRPNPFRFRAAGAVQRIEADLEIGEDEKSARISKLPERARLPYLLLTDIDVPNAVYGKSAVDYAAPLQDNLSRLDSSQLDAIQAHGVARLIVSDQSEVTEMGNSNFEVTKIAGGPANGPYFMHPPQLMPEMDKTRMYLVQGLSDVMGLNESQFGQQSREQAQATMQYAVNQGNMIRRRLFNKYVLFVEALYRNILDLVRKHWDTDRTLNVVGKEHALEAVDISGMDVDGGYDVVGDYGVSLSLDPVARKQELLMLQPLLKEAGIPARRTLQLMKLSELEGAYDEIELADNRQREIFEKMVALVKTGATPEEAYIPPKKYRDHENMIAYALRYFMTEEFENLPDEVQAICERHIDERAQLAAAEQAGMLGGSPGIAQQTNTAPGPVPGQPADVPQVEASSPAETTGVLPPG